MKRLAATCLFLSINAQAAQAVAPVPEQPIIVTAPGGAADEDDAVELDAAKLALASGPDVLRAVSTQVAGMSLSDAQGNRHQPSLMYRGYSASALQGHAQGLAVFLDGGRFNAPFGDTVNFDLLPDVAVERVSVRDSNPVYGLNGLGGAVVVATHTGRSSPGQSALLALGDHGQRKANMTLGYDQGTFSLFMAGQAERERGWRAFSPSTLYHGFADMGWDGAQAGVHIKALAADTDLAGNGASPVELLAANRAAVFTHPDRTANQLFRGSLHPWIELDEGSRLEASLYIQSLRQLTENGDVADIEPCASNGGLLCLGHDAGRFAFLQDRTGAIIPSRLGIEDYAVVNRTRTRSTSGGMVLHYVRQEEIFGQSHKVILGLTHDRAQTRFGAETELGALEEDRGVTGLGPIIRQADLAIAPIDLAVRTRSTGLFVWDEIRLSPRLSAELGLRWTDARLDLDDQLGIALDGRHRFHRLNPSVEFEYRLPEKAALRFGYSETSRAPTPAELSCAQESAPCSLTNFFVADPPLNQVIARTWEAGAQGRWSAGGWRGEWSVSLYRSGIDNDLLLTAAPTRGRAFFQNIGQSRRQGGEAQWSANKGAWAVKLGYAYVQAQFLSPFVANSPNNPAADDQGRIAIPAGAHLAGLPAHRGVASLAYASNGFTIEASVQAQSHQWRMGDEANLDRPVAGFARLDVGTTWTLRPGLTAFVDMTNVLNRHYASFGTYAAIDGVHLQEVPNAVDTRANTPSAPRRFMIGARLRR